MQLSVMLTSLPCNFATAIRQASSLGFTWVDIVAVVDRPDTDIEALAGSGLVVKCASVGRDLPDHLRFDAENLQHRREALDAMKRQIADAAHLGATHCYVVPGLDGSSDALVRFGECCDLLAEFATSRMMDLCVEHFPGRALASARQTIDWIRGRHPSLRLLLDVGHCLISGEEPAEVVRLASDVLGYVHLDDNDGSNDQHWPLFSGRLTPKMLGDCIATLRQIGYSGPLSFELNPTNKDPMQALREGKRAVEELID